MRTPYSGNRFISHAILSIALATAASAVHAQTRVRFSFDWLMQGTAAFFLLPQAKGYFKQEGLDVTVDVGNGSAGVLNRVATGTHDLCTADVTALIEFLVQNAGFPTAQLQGIFSLYDASPAAVVTLKRTGITRPADLQGRTLGAPTFDAGRKAFPIFARNNGLDLQKIKWSTMDPPLRETMLVRGDVDAVTGYLFAVHFSLLQRGAKEDEIVAFKYSDSGSTLYGQFIVASPRFIAEQPEAVAKFNRALVRGIREVLADPEAAVQYVRARDPLIDVGLELRRLKMAIDVSMATPAAKSSGIGAVNKLRLEESTAAVVTAFGLKASPNVDNMFNSSFLPSRAERAVFSR